MYAQQQDQAFMPPCEGVHGPCATMARSQIMLRKGVPMSIDRSPYARFSENPTQFPEHLRRLNLSVGVVQYLKEGVPKEEIARQLVRAGIEPGNASAFVESRDRNRRGLNKSSTKTALFIGLGLIAWGLSISVPKAILGIPPNGADVLAVCLAVAGMAACTVALANKLQKPMRT